MKMIKYLYNKLKNIFPFSVFRSKLRSFIISLIQSEIAKFSAESGQAYSGRFSYLESLVRSHYNLGLRGKMIPESFSFGYGSNIIIPEDCILELGQGVYIGRNTEIGPYRKITIGDFTSVQDRCIILGNVNIGRYCIFSYNIYISSGRHFFDYRPFLNMKDQDRLLTADTRMHSELDRPVIIEDDVWIGYNVMIMSGVRIGKGSVIGSNSVVTKDILPYSIAVGTPARVLKKRLEFIPPSEIRWDREEDFPYFYSGFCVSLEERDIFQKENGLAVNRLFSVSLKAEGKSRIRIVLKKIQKEKTQIKYNDTIYDIADQFSEIIFSVSMNADPVQFEILSESGKMDKTVIVSEISAGS